MVFDGTWNRLHYVHIHFLTIEIISIGTRCSITASFLLTKKLTVAVRLPGFNYPHIYFLTIDIVSIGSRFNITLRASEVPY